MSSAKVWAVVPAAGKGMRMGADIPKQYLPLAGKPVLAHTLAVLVGHPRIDAVVVVLSRDDEWWPNIAPSIRSAVRTVTGGAERCHSVLAGVESVMLSADNNDWVLVHDAARPCLRATDIDRMIDELATNDCGGILAVPVRDTLKRCRENGEIEETVDRTRLWHALTPQMYRIARLRDALRSVITNDRLVTDEAQAIESAGGVSRIIEGHGDNIKITHRADLALAEIFLNAQQRG